MVELLRLIARAPTIVDTPLDSVKNEVDGYLTGREHTHIRRDMACRWMGGWVREEVGKVRWRDEKWQERIDGQTNQNAPFSTSTRIAFMFIYIFTHAGT